MQGATWATAMHRAGRPWVMGARLALQEVLKLRSQTQSENPGFTTDSLCDLGQVAQPS